MGKMRFASAVGFAIALHSCGEDMEANSVNATVHFQQWSCAPALSDQIAANLEGFASEKGKTVGVHEITAGGEGFVVRVASSDQMDGEVELLFNVLDDADEITVRASMAGEPTDRDVEFAKSVLDASQLSECR